MKNFYIRLVFILSALMFISSTINSQTPSLSAPVNGSTWDSTTPTLFWWSSTSGTETYTVQVSTSSTDFTSAGVSKVNTTVVGSGSASYAIPLSAGLFVGIKYYWRIGVNGNFSTVWNFTPANGITPTYNTISLSVPGGNGSASITPGQANYLSGTSIQLDATPDPGYDFAGWGGDANGLTNPLIITITSDLTITASFIPKPFYTLTTNVNGLGSVVKAPDQTNYLSGSNVQLTATPDIGAIFTGWSGDAAGSTNPLSVDMTSNKSITANFQTLNFGGILISPLDEATDVSQSPTFLWNTYSGATSYQILVSTQSDFSSTVVDVTDPSDTAYTASGLLAQQLYYWKVVITTGSGNLESSVWQFTTGGLLKPLLTSPSHGVTGIGINPTQFTWNSVSGATAYDLEISTSSNFTAPVQQTDITDLFFDLNGLSSSTIYYARLQAKNGSDPNSEWSNTISFTTGTAPGYFSLVGPDFSLLQPATKVKFQWEESDGATSYQLIVSNTHNLLNEIDTVVVDTTFTGILMPGSRYTWGVLAKNSIGSKESDQIFTFFTADTFYVATTGDDDPTSGSENNPFRTINYAINNTPHGSALKVLTGTYVEDVIISNPVTLLGYGVSSPRISYLIVGSSNVTVKNFEINNSTGTSTTGLGIFGPPPGAAPPLESIVIDNVNISPGSGFDQGFRGNFASGAVISNCDFSGNAGDGMELEDSFDLVFKNISCDDNNEFGMIIRDSRNLTFNGASFTDNNRSNASFHGIIMIEVYSSTFTNVNSGNSGYQYQSDGLNLFSGSDLTFTDCTFNNNLSSGVQLETNFSGGIPPVISNITFAGNCEFVENTETGVDVKAYSSSEFISGLTFTGRPLFSDNVFAALIMLGDVSNVIIEGAQFVNTVIEPFGIVFGGSGPSPSGLVPENISVHNSVFSMFSPVAKAIALFPEMTNDVDATNNAFYDAVDAIDLEEYIYDTLDELYLGDIITDGATFGPSPEYVVESLNPAYTGASYLVDIDFYPKSDSYVSLSGTFVYDNTKLEYLGYLNDGMINDNAWSLLSVTETVSGSISELAFTGWGINPIISSGKLFTLNMKVKETADTSNSPTFITPDLPDFTGLTLSGPPAYPFSITNGVIEFFSTNAAIQSKGDVNLDAVVDLDDFNLLLLYVAGNTLIITDAQALDNADYDNDSDIDNDDLTAVYNLINGNTPPAAPIIASGLLDFNQLQFIQDFKSVSIPILLKDVERLNSFEIELRYDPEQISYQAFKTELDETNYHALGYEVQPGIAKYNVYSKESLNGSFNPGELILRFVEESVPDNAEIFTRYKFNGREFIDGPVITIADGSITDVEEDLIPEAFEVSQNYPNPFNPTTTIRFGVVDPGFVSIKVFNMLGEEVKSIVNNEFNVGFHQVNWNGDDNFGTKVSSGTYIYRVINGSNVVTKKMLLLK